MPRTTHDPYTSHEDLLQEVKAMNTYRDYRQGGGGNFAKMQKKQTHVFPKKTYQSSTDSNDSVMHEKKGKVFYLTSLDQKSR